MPEGSTVACRLGSKLFVAWAVVFALIGVALSPGVRGGGGGTATGCTGEFVADAFGVHHRVFSDNQTGVGQVFYQNDRGNPVCAFSNALAISPGTIDSADPQVDVDTTSNLVYVAWHDNGSDSRVLTLTMSDDNGTSWLTPKQLGLLPSTFASWNITYWEDFLNITVDGVPYNYLTVPGEVYRSLYTVALRNYTFDVRAGEPPLPPGLAIPGYMPGTDGYYLVQMKGTIEQDWINRTIALGGAVFDFVPFSSFIVRLTDSERAALEAEDFVGWTGIYQPAYKISPALDSAVGTVNLTVLAFKGENLTSIRTAIESLNGTVTFEGDTGLDGMLLCSIDASKIPQVAALLGVYSIGPTEPVEVMNDQARLVIQSGGTTSPIHDRGLQGQGQRIAMADTGLAVGHEAFTDPNVQCPPPGQPQGGLCPGHRKLVGYIIPAGAGGDLVANTITPAQPGLPCRPDHGTHVGGSVVGDAPVIGQYSGNPRRDGQSFRGLLLVEDIDNTNCDGFLFPPNVLANLYNPALQNQAFIHTNSWGGGGAGYADPSRQIDAFMWNNPDFLILHAAGNSGPNARTLTTQAQAKNVIAVGASGNGALANNLAQGDGGAYFSSRGPTVDGRMGPTLIAPGQDVFSANSLTGGYIDYDGTSMATPTTAGAAALVRQYFVDGWYPLGMVGNPSDSLIPSSALIRAVLIAGAQEITGTQAYANGENFFPNNQQGWGRVNLDRSLYLSGDARRLAVFDERRGLLTGEYVEFDVQVTSTAEDARIVLEWTDAPGNPNTCGANSPCLRNNLDLRVTKLNDNRVLRGNVFQRLPAPQIGRGSVEGGTFDTLNNAEAVILLPGRDVFQPTTYRIRVTGTNVPQGPQPFAIAVTGRVTDFRPIGWHVLKGFQPTLGGTEGTSDGGIAWGYIDNDPMPDALFMAVLDNPTGSDAYTYRIGWDFDWERGDFTNFGPNQPAQLVCPQIPTGCGTIQGADVELVQADGDGLLDAIFMAIDSPDPYSNFFRYRVFFDLNTNGVFTGGSTMERGGWNVGSWSNEGGGLSCASIGGGGQPDCLFMAIDDGLFDSQYRYLVAYDLNALGDFATVSPIKGYMSTGWTIGRGGGVDLANIGGGSGLDAVFTMVGYYNFLNVVVMTWFQYRVAFDINANGDFVGGWTLPQQSRGDPLTRDPRGGGVAIEWLDGYFRWDVMFMVIAEVPGPNEYRYRVGYNIDGQGRFAN